MIMNKTRFGRPPGRDPNHIIMMAVCVLIIACRLMPDITLLALVVMLAVLL